MDFVFFSAKRSGTRINKNVNVTRGTILFEYKWYGNCRRRDEKTMDVITVVSP